MTDGERVELEKFCDENKCTQYSALKTALRELLSGRVKETKEKIVIPQERESLEKSFQDSEAAEENGQADKIGSLLKKLLRSRHQQTS